MSEAYTFLELLQPAVTVPPNGILSQTVYSDEHLKLVLFHFAPGAELSEHTAALPAIIHILQGEAALTLNGEAREARPGTWVRMPAHLPHSVRANTPLVMALQLLKAD